MKISGVSYYFGSKERIGCEANALAACYLPLRSGTTVGLIGGGFTQRRGERQGQS